MDAILLSFIITATWVLYEYTLTYRTDRLILGTLCLSLAFATKGMTGAAVPVIAVGSQLLFQRNWTFIRSLKWLWAILLFFLFISPVIYCYYLQFDLHPEKVIRGMHHISGIAFILFFQNTERLAGVNWGSSGGNDPFLFFHSLLWALLPWCLLAYWAIFRREMFLFRSKFSFKPGEEILSWATIVVMFTVLTSSHFRLPHYLNILFPFFSILIAGELQKAAADKGGRKWLMIIQKFVAVVMLLFGFIINGYIFPVKNVGVGIFGLSALFLLFYEWRYNQAFVSKRVMISFCSSLFANLLMNGNFYKQLQDYQAGHHVAARIRQLEISENNVYIMNWNSPSMHYYASYFFKQADANVLTQQKEFWVTGPIDSIQVLAQTGQLEIKESYLVPDFDTTKLKAGFLNPETRQEACEISAWSTSKKNDNPLKAYLKWAVKLLATGLLLYWAFIHTDTDNILKVIGESYKGLLLLAFVPYIASRLAGAFRLTTILNSADIAISQTSGLRLNWIAMFYGMFLPGGLGGDAYKFIRLKQLFPDKNALLMTRVLLWDRLIGLVVLTVMTAIFSMLYLPGNYQILMVLAVLAGCVIFYLVTKKWLPAFLPRLGRSLVFSLIVQLTQIGCICILLFSIQVYAGYSQFSLLFLVSSVASTLPVSICGVGMREVVFLKGAEILAMSIQSAVTVSVLFDIIVTLTAVTGSFGTLTRGR